MICCLWRLFETIIFSLSLFLFLLSFNWIYLVLNKWFPFHFLHLFSNTFYLKTTKLSYNSSLFFRTFFSTKIISFISNTFWTSSFTIYHHQKPTFLSLDEHPNHWINASVMICNSKAIYLESEKKDFDYWVYFYPFTWKIGADW